jgi:GNAT superfamily N-acetyltransferase
MARERGTYHHHVRRRYRLAADQTTDSTLFLGQLYLSGHMQRQGIGTGVLQMLIEEARRAGKPVTLGVVKINPARRLYERLGFQRTHEDRHKVYMQLEPGG